MTQNTTIPWWVREKIIEVKIFAITIFASKESSQMFAEL
jgi:hypothetical protein